MKSYPRSSGFAVIELLVPAALVALVLLLFLKFALWNPRVLESSESTSRQRSD